MNMTRAEDCVEVIVKDRRRRRWSPAEKAALVRRTYEPGMCVSLVARPETVAASVLFQWRKLDRQGALTAVAAGEAVVPASELTAARAEIAKLQRVLGKKTLENEILKEAVEYAAEKKRSHLQELRSRPASWCVGRTARTPAHDEQLLADIGEQIAQLPSYGYRRACALVNRKRAAMGAARMNPKRVYRVMAGGVLLLHKAPRRRQSSRPHEGKVAAGRAGARDADRGGGKALWRRRGNSCRSSPCCLIW